MTNRQPVRSSGVHIIIILYTYVGPVRFLRPVHARLLLAFRCFFFSRLIRYICATAGGKRVFCVGAQTLPAMDERIEWKKPKVYVLYYYCVFFFLFQRQKRY